MRLKLEGWIPHYARTTSDQYGVFDEVTGKSVGTLIIDRYLGRRPLTRIV
jgi:hypothetical protein